MAKAPRQGAVKTRLASSLSPAAAVSFYCCLLDDTLVLARSLGDVEVAIMKTESRQAYCNCARTAPNIESV